MEKYHECMQITSQFKFCPNTFRIDLYRGCDFGCRYCFANLEIFGEEDKSMTTWRVADFKCIKRKFERAFESDEPTKDVIVELLRHRVPLHCGGMSDPFQSREWELRLTYKLIELSNQYNYPICFSTKTSHLPQEYIDILNPSIHAFQVSIIGLSDEYIRLWECNTPTAQERIEFVRQLRGLGFWCSVRIQPVIELDEVLNLIDALGSLPSYLSVEHLHMKSNNYSGKSWIYSNLENNPNFEWVGSVLQFKQSVKKQNLAIIMERANKYGVLVGAADNDLHYMTQSRCCCGIDTINENFDNYLKFNTTYLSTGESNISEMFIPKCNLRKHMNVGAGVKHVDAKQFVTNYIANNPQLIPNEYRVDIEKELFGYSKKPLF